MYVCSICRTLKSSFPKLNQSRLNQSAIQVNRWPNLKNLSGGLNLSRGLNMVGST